MLRGTPYISVSCESLAVDDLKASVATRGHDRWIQHIAEPLQRLFHPITAKIMIVPPNELFGKEQLSETCYWYW